MQGDRERRPLSCGIYIIELILALWKLTEIKIPQISHFLCRSPHIKASTLLDKGRIPFDEVYVTRLFIIPTCLFYFIFLHIQLKM